MISYVNSALLEIQIIVLYLALAQSVFHCGTIVLFSYLNNHKKCDVLVSSFEDKEKVKPYLQQITFPLKFTSAFRSELSSIEDNSRNITVAI